MTLLDLHGVLTHNVKMQTNRRFAQGMVRASLFRPMRKSVVNLAEACGVGRSLV